MHTFDASNFLKLECLTELTELKSRRHKSIHLQYESEKKKKNTQFRLIILFDRIQPSIQTFIFLPDDWINYNVKRLNFAYKMQLSTRVLYIWFAIKIIASISSHISIFLNAQQKKSLSKNRIFLFFFQAKERRATKSSSSLARHRIRAKLCTRWNRFSSCE